MYIRDFYKKKKFVLSCEVFPPKTSDDVDKLYKTIEDLRVINPDYVSVTYGAGGSTREKTVEIASFIKNNIGVEVMAHLTCVNSTKEDIANVLAGLKEKNIDNVLALRGDPPQGQTNFTKQIGGFGYASELVEFIRKTVDMGIGVAGYPEKHPEAVDYKIDLDYLVKKVEKGADFIVSQLFFENDDFFRFRDDLRKKGVKIPVIPGVFPILSYKTIKKISSLCGAVLPEKLNAKMEKVQDDNAQVEKYGIEHAIKQTEDLIRRGVEGVHLYSMNKSSQIIEIYDAVKSFI